MVFGFENLMLFFSPFFPFPFLDKEDKMSQWFCIVETFETSIDLQPGAIMCLYSATDIGSDTLLNQIMLLLSRPILALSQYYRRLDINLIWLKIKSRTSPQDAGALATRPSRGSVRNYHHQRQYLCMLCAKVSSNISTTIPLSFSGRTIAIGIKCGCSVLCGKGIINDFHHRQSFSK